MTEEVTGDLNSSEWESEIEEVLEEKSVSNVSDVEINSFIAAANPNSDSENYNCKEDATVNTCPYVLVKLNGIPIPGLLDTGAQGSAMSKKLHEIINRKKNTNKLRELLVANTMLKSALGNRDKFMLKLKLVNNQSGSAI